MRMGETGRSKAVAVGVCISRPAAEMTAVGPGEGQVDIVAWAGYIERGETDKNYDWVTDFEAKTGCKVNVKTAATSDEMVALMNEGGFDLVTASGDASLRLIAGKTRPADQYQPDPELGHGRSAPAGCAVAHGRRRPLRRPLSVGLQRAHVQHRGLQGGADELERRLRGDGPARRQAEQGPRPGLRRPDLYRRRRALLMTHKPELGIKDPYELNEDQYKAALELLRAQRQIVGRYWHDAFVQIDDFKNEGVVASSSWPFQVNILKSREAADRQHRARAKARPDGPTPP